VRLSRRPEQRPADTLITVSDIRAPRVEINGRLADLQQIWELDLSSGGHFTAMQVRERKTLGLDFHLARLDAATWELFGEGLDGDRVRAWVRHALRRDAADATVRVNVFRPAAGGDVSVAVSVRPPAAPPAQEQSLQAVTYQRPAAQLKRSSGFGQAYYGSLAHENGFDEALFTGPDGAICEGSITNIGFIDGETIVWPDGPALNGIIMQVLQRELDRAGLPWRRGPVRLADLPSFGGAFLTNSHGMATVARIDDLSLPTDATLMRTAERLLGAAPYDPI
jgi:branched-subunit amino acid aminotransferase/4-amino-4-deoxychorismate lyase